MVFNSITNDLCNKNVPSHSYFPEITQFSRNCFLESGLAILTGEFFALVCVCHCSIACCLGKCPDEVTRPQDVPRQDAQGYTKSYTCTYSCSFTSLSDKIKLQFKAQCCYLHNRCISSNEILEDKLHFECMPGCVFFIYIMFRCKSKFAAYTMHNNKPNDLPFISIFAKC